MTHEQYTEVQQRLQKLANYYKNIDFPNLSRSFQEAADTINELAATLKDYEAKFGAIDNPPIEEEGSGTEV